MGDVGKVEHITSKGHCTIPGPSVGGASERRGMGRRIELKSWKKYSNSREDDNRRKSSD